MNKYRYVGNGRKWVRRIGLVVETGDVVETPIEINDANFERVTEKEKPALPAKETH